MTTNNNYENLCECEEFNTINVLNCITGQKFLLKDLVDNTIKIKPNHYYNVICNPTDISQSKISYLGKELKEKLQKELHKPFTESQNIPTDALDITDIYVINLDRSPERWKHMQKQLKITNLTYQRFSAIDGYKVVIEDKETGNKFLGFDLKNNIYPIKKGHLYTIHCDPNDLETNSFDWVNKPGLRPTTAGEFGVWCSHYTIWKKIVNQNIKQAIILEDDIQIKSYHIAQDLNYFIQKLPKGWDLALIDYSGPLKPSTLEKKPCQSVNISHISINDNYKLWWGAWALMVSFDGAKKLLDKTPYHQAALDDFLPYQTKYSLLNGYISDIELISLDSIWTKSTIDEMTTRHYIRSPDII